MAKRGTPHHEYDLLEQVGTGSFGTVHRAVTKSSHEIVAIKIMKKTSKGDCSNAREYRTLKNLALHPNIVKLYDSYVGPAKELYFVMEYMNGGNLYQLIKQRREAERPLEHSEVRSILRQTLTALAHLHQQGIFHRDMKPENLLIGFKNKKTMKSQGQQISNNDNAQKEDEMIIKLADFGLAREIKSKPPYTEYVSTRWYRAPEVLLHSTQYSHPVDIWAVGAIFAELVTLKPIFPGRSEIDQLYRICQILGNPLGTIVIKQRRLTPLLKKSSDQQTPSSSTSAITKKTTITSQHPPSLPPLNHHQQQSPPQQQHQQHDIVQQQQQPPISPPPDPRRDWSDGIRLARKMGFDFPQLSPKPLSIVLPTATQPMLDLLQQFLTFDPTKRINAVDALNSTFLSSKMNAHHSITADTTISDEEGKRNSSARTKSTTTSTSPPSTTTTTTTTSTIPCILIKQLPSTTTNDNNNNNENISPPPEPQPQRKSLLWAKGVAMGPPKTPASPRQSQQQQSVNPKPSSSNMAQDIKGVLRLSKSKTIDRLQRKKPSLTSLRIAAANIGRSASSYDFGGFSQQQQRQRSSSIEQEQLQDTIASSSPAPPPIPQQQPSMSIFRKKKPPYPTTTTTTTTTTSKTQKTLSPLHHHHHHNRSTSALSNNSKNHSISHSSRRSSTQSLRTKKAIVEQQQQQSQPHQQQGTFDLPSIPMLSPIQMCSDWESNTTRAVSLYSKEWCK